MRLTQIASRKEGKFVQHERGVAPTPHQDQPVAETKLLIATTDGPNPLYTKAHNGSKLNQQGGAQRKYHSKTHGYCVGARV
jgi:hypothetical protein